MALRMDAENTYQVFDWLWTSGQLSARDIEQLPVSCTAGWGFRNAWDAASSRAVSAQTPSSRWRTASKISGKAIANLIAPIHLNFCWRIRREELSILGL
jgi:hypothetical protein